MDKIRLGIIGMGRMGLTHFSIINTHPNVDIVSVSDTSTLILEMMKKYIPDLQVYNDYAKLISAGNLDGIIVSTPSSLHYQICKMAYDNNVAVFCEKPFTTNRELSKELAELFEKKNLVNQVGYVYRFDPVFREVQQLLSKNIIGEISHVSANFLSATKIKMKESESWRSKRENGGGATYEMGSHVFDLLQFFLGVPQHVVASMLGTVYSGNVEDICMAEVLYEKNIPASVYVNWSDYTYRKPMLKLEFFGTKGKLCADLYGYNLYLRECDNVNDISQGWTTVPMNMIPDSAQYYVRGTSFSNQLYEFANAIIEKRKSKGCSFRDASDTQNLISVIFENDKIQHEWKK